MLALRCLCGTRALRARRDYKPRGSALRASLREEQLPVMSFHKQFLCLSLQCNLSFYIKKPQQDLPFNDDCGKGDLENCA